ncbi:hypothetical protein D3C78_1558410 [compost metagenome]
MQQAEIVGIALDLQRIQRQLGLLAVARQVLLQQARQRLAAAQNADQRTGPGGQQGGGALRHRREDGLDFIGLVQAQALDGRSGLHRRYPRA